MKRYDPDNDETLDLVECQGCEGVGYIDIGDPEDGVTETCPICDGVGQVEEWSKYDR